MFENDAERVSAVMAVSFDMGPKRPVIQHRMPSAVSGNEREGNDDSTEVQRLAGEPVKPQYDPEKQRERTDHEQQRTRITQLSDRRIGYECMSPCVG